MKEWIKVITDPMGLAGFALFLVFTILAKRKKPSWLPAGAFAMACVALVGGLTLAYSRVHATPLIQPHVANQHSPASSTVNQQAIGEIKQESSGASAVNAAGVQGQITVNNTSPTPAGPAMEKNKKGKK